MYTRTPSPFPTSDSADRALVLATVPSLDPPHFLAPIISTAASSTRSHITILLFSRLFNSPTATTLRGVSRTERFDDVLRLLTYVYVQATSVAQSLDKVLMTVDVLLLGIDADVPTNLGTGIDIVYRVAGDTIAVPLPPSILTLHQIYLHSAPDIEVNYIPPLSPIASGDATPPYLPVVALGGTFDHLHAGHKILLSMGAWIAGEKLIVGVTDDGLLKNKSHPSLLQSLAERIAAVRAFLLLFRPDITHDIVPIHDVYGPTGWDPNVQGLVVSRETVSGADAVAAHRLAHGLPALQTFIIDVISPHDPRLDHDDMEMLKRTKMSSTFIREWMYERKMEKGDAMTVREKIAKAEKEREKVRKERERVEEVDRERAKERVENEREREMAERQRQRMDRERVEKEREREREMNKEKSRNHNGL